MVRIIWDFNEFMNSDFKSLSIGFTPSGHLHLGFLTTLATALMYLREHPKTHLIITSVENSLSNRLDKYNYYPLRYQYLYNDSLIVPKDFKSFKKRNSASYTVLKELHDLIWKLVKILDTRTSSELRLIKQSFIPPKHKRWLEEKEHRIFHFFGSQIYIYSFLKVLEKDKSLRNNILRFLCDYDFAKTVAPIVGINIKWMNFGNTLVVRGKRYRPRAYRVPLRVYCPSCYMLCPEWAMIVIGHPHFAGPVLASRCTNADCPSKKDVLANDEAYVFVPLKDSLSYGEFHFMLNSMRDFFSPFRADCHIFGGDYFQIQYQYSGIRAIDRIKDMFLFLEKKTGQSKSIFGGPLITVGGQKMSKSGVAVKINQISKIKKVFSNILDILEKARRESYPEGLKLEYDTLLRNAS